MACNQPLHGYRHRPKKRRVELEKSTPLHSAVEDGYACIVDQLLKLQANINGKIAGGFTPLHVAVRKGKLECFHLLLERGAAIDITDNQGKIPLHHAAQNGELLMLKKLLKFEFTINTKDGSGCSPLHIAIEHQNLDCVGILLDAGASIDIQDCQGRTPLCVAIRKGCCSVVEEILARNRDADVHGLNASDIFIESGNPDCLEVLLNAGVDTDIVDKIEFKSLQNAALHGNEFIWNLLMGRQPKALVDKFKQFQLFETVLFYDRANYFNDLLDAGADVHIKDEETKMTLLHLAAHCKSESPLTTLLAFDLDINAQDDKGDTPLHLASVFQRVKNVLLLLDAGARWDIENNNKRTMLWNLLRSLYLYQPSGAEIAMFRCILERTNHGQVIDPSTNYTAAHYVMHPLFMQYSNFNIVFAMLVVSTQKSLGGVDAEGCSVVHYITHNLESIGKNAVPLIRICIERGAYLDSQDCDLIKNDPYILGSLLRDEHFCVQSIANQFNNCTLVKFYEHLKDVRTVPIQSLRITPMRGSWTIIEQDARLEIEREGYCDVSHLVTTSLSKQCIEVSLKIFTNVQTD